MVLRFISVDTALMEDGLDQICPISSETAL